MNLDLATGSRTTRRVRTLAIGAALVLAALVLGGCFGGDDDADSTSASKGEPMRLDLLVFNIEYGGNGSTDKVIKKLDADVVGVLESYERLPEIARKTGYPYYNTSLQLLSKYPILEPSGGDGLYAMIEVQPGYVIPFFNDHLDYVEWGPRALQNGESVDSVVATENEVRTASLARPIEAMGQLLDQGYPVFLTGDFNEPSSLDYGADTVGTRKGIDEPVPWPVSETPLRPRLPRHLPRDPSRSGRRARDHAGAQRRAHRLRLRGRALDDDPEQARRRARRGGRGHRLRPLGLRPSRGALDAST